jgi:hypothetical protein
VGRIRLGLENARLSSARAWPTEPSISPRARASPSKTIDAIDVAAKYFVYKLYEATDGQPMRWATLRGIGEVRATVERAVESGWVILEGTSGRPLERKAVTIRR